MTKWYLDKNKLKEFDDFLHKYEQTIFDYLVGENSDDECGNFLGNIMCSQQEVLETAKNIFEQNITIEQYFARRKKINEYHKKMQSLNGDFFNGGKYNFYEIQLNVNSAVQDYENDFEDFKAIYTYYVEHEK